MMKPSKESLAKRAERKKTRASQAAVAAASPPSKVRFWIVLQGDVLDKVDGETQPELTVKPGERRKRIVGAYANKEDREKAFEAMKGRARGIVGRGVAR